MPQRSAGVVLYRRTGNSIEILLVHPGGPFWAKKDDGAWGIPKGLIEAGEEPIAVARREFQEETGAEVEGELAPLGTFTQSRAKVIEVWAAEGDFDPATLKSNTFPMEWPPRSGRMQEFPEVDRAQWFGPDAARIKMLKGQRPVIDALMQRLAGEAWPERRGFTSRSGWPAPWHQRRRPV
jgi:predicted NUDIX family NTP pyrophosphohydrolase